MGPDFGNLGRTDRTLATRFSAAAAAAAIGLAGGVLAAAPAGTAAALPRPAAVSVGVAAGWSAAYSTGPGTVVTVTGASSTTTSGTLIGFPAFTRGPIRFDLEAGTVGFPVPGTAAPARAAAPAAAAPEQRTVEPVALPPAAADPVNNTPPADPAAHQPMQRHEPAQPFHKTGRKARSLPDTGVPLSAALGAVTALTALLAGIGTVLAARRRPDHEARR